MQAVADVLNEVVFTLWGNPLSWGEVLGFATGLWCVWLATRRHILNFPVGIANCALLLFLFWEARLFADASLQLVFIALGLQGWWLWWRSQEALHVPVSHVDTRELAWILATCAIGAMLLYSVLTLAKGSVPVLDALITSLSLAAQWLLNRRKIENWYFWITVDVISIPLYAYKQLYLISLLYVVFLGLCLVGLRAWRAEATAVMAKSTVMA